MDPYSTLGIDEGADKDDIKKAYKKKASENHPDKVGGGSTEMVAINKAYSILSDEEKKSNYDKYGNSESNLEQDTKSVLCQLFMLLIDSTNNLEIDLKKSMIKNLNENSHEHHKQIKKNRKQIKKYMKVKSKLKSKNKMFASTINEQMIILDHNIRESEYKIQVLELCLKNMDDFNYEFEQSDGSGLPSWIGESGTAGNPL